MAEGLSDTDIQLFGSTLEFTQQLVSRADEYLDDGTLLMVGSIAAVLGVSAVVAEILAGTDSWAGNKNDPTTLGWVTIGLGLAWIPAAVAATVACAQVVRRPRPTGAWRAVIRSQWAPALVVVLSLIYLAFGIVARDRIGLLGVAGAGLTCAALAVRVRSHVAAAIGLVLAAVPFGVATAWSVVTPLTAVSMLAIGLPYLLGHPHTISSAGETS